MSLLDTLLSHTTGYERMSISKALNTCFFPIMPKLDTMIMNKAPILQTRNVIITVVLTIFFLFHPATRTLR